MSKKIVTAFEFVVYRSRNGGYTSDPVGFVFAATKTEAARIGRKKYGPGTYSADKAARISKEQFPYWLRTGEPRPQILGTGPNGPILL